MIAAYKTLASSCDVIIDKYASCYTRTGQSEVFLATSEIKCHVEDVLKYPVLNESIKELRLWIECEYFDIEYFKSVIKINKLKLEDYLRVANDMKTLNLNLIINRKEILIAEDAKNIKMMKNRSTGYVGTIASEVLKTHNFMKIKSKLKAALEDKIRIETEKNI